MMHDDLQQGFDRVLLASFAPEKARAARFIAGRLVYALATLEVREGVLIAQLDELVLGADAVFANVPFLPSEPVALCLTGTPRLVAAVRSGIEKSTNARFAFKRQVSHVQGLRVAAVVRDAAVTLDVNRELAGEGPRVLTLKGWKVVEATGECESTADLALLEAEAILHKLAVQEPTPYVAPVEPRAKKRTSKPAIDFWKLAKPGRADVAIEQAKGANLNRKPAKSTRKASSRPTSGARRTRASRKTS